MHTINKKYTTPKRFFKQFYKVGILAALIFIQYGCSSDDDTPVPTKLTDVEILTQLFNANSDNTLEWDLTNQTMDSWNGVTHQNGNVTELNLDDKNLAIIPKEIRNLTSLTHLYLDNNSLITIPVEVGNLTSLTHLYLNDNPLTSIPQVVCDLETNQGTIIYKDAGVTCM